jgi:hypothetical protein
MGIKESRIAVRIQKAETAFEEFLPKKLRRNKTRVIVGEPTGMFVISPKVEPIFPLAISPELNNAYKEVMSQCITTKDPFYQISELDRITDDPSFQGLERYKELLAGEFKMMRRFMSKIESKNGEPKESGPIITPIMLDGECVGQNTVKIHQFSENLITVYGDETFKFPGKEREHHATMFDFHSDPGNPDKLMFVAMEDHNILSEKGIPLRFMLTKFPNPKIK